MRDPVVRRCLLRDGEFCRQDEPLLCGRLLVRTPKGPSELHDPRLKVARCTQIIESVLADRPLAVPSALPVVYLDVHTDEQIQVSDARLDFGRGWHGPRTSKFNLRRSGDLQGTFLRRSAESKPLPTRATIRPTICQRADFEHAARQLPRASHVPCTFFESRHPCL